MLSSVSRFFGFSGSSNNNNTQDGIRIKPVSTTIEEVDAALKKYLEGSPEWTVLNMLKTL
jgi:hypothetical protein